MEGRKSNTNKLILEYDFEDDLDPYFYKKQSALYLLGKILYGVIIFVLLGFGVYFIFKSKQDDVSQDLINFNKKTALWNDTFVKELEDWKIQIKNEKNSTLIFEKDHKKMHHYDDGENLYYEPFQFVLKNMAPLISNVQLKKKKSDLSSYSYNLTADFVIEINNTFSSRKLELNDVDLFIRAAAPKVKQSDCVKNRGVWNYEDTMCYKYYMLRTLCLIIDQRTRELYSDYKHFKCNEFNEWYESFSIFPWMVPSYDPSFDDLEALNKKIGVYLSTDRDPYVWANYNGTLHFSNLAESYSVAGVWLITCALALLIIPLLIYFKGNNLNLDKGEIQRVEQLRSLSNKNINTVIIR